MSLAVPAMQCSLFQTVGWSNFTCTTEMARVADQAFNNHIMQRHGLPPEDHFGTVVVSMLPAEHDFSRQYCICKLLSA